MADEGRVRIIDRDTWRELAQARIAVVVLALSDCEACAAWTKELESFLATDHEWSDVPFGKALLDQPGLVEFKRENPWLSELDALPFTQIFAHGKPAKGFAGDGIPRLVSRLRSVAEQAATS